MNSYIHVFPFTPVLCCMQVYLDIWCYGDCKIMKKWPIYISMRLGTGILLHATLVHFSTWFFALNLPKLPPFWVWLNAFRSKKMLDPSKDSSLNLKTIHIIIWVTVMFRWFDALKRQKMDPFYTCTQICPDTLACKLFWGPTKSPISIILIWPVV